MKLNRFAIFSWGVLAFSVGVILWGAYVRATGSGAGCGSHWPLCNGEVIPRSPALETSIEFIHRASSGLSLLLVLGMAVWAFRAYAKGHPVRIGAGLSLFFILLEALVGAGLVKFGWVAKDASSARVVTMAVHLVNTFLLLAGLTLTAWWASGGAALRFKGQGLALWGLGLGFLGVLLLGVSGSIAALGDTLFPSSSLAEAIRQDFSPAAHFLIRLRPLHPIIAILVGLYLIFVSGLIAMLRPGSVLKRLAVAFSVLFVIQLGVGLVNVALLAPVPVQIIHLLLADSVWISLVLLAAETFGQGEPQHQEAGASHNAAYGEPQRL